MTDGYASYPEKSINKLIEIRKKDPTKFIYYYYGI
jgi:hypothetical protein